MPVCSRRRLLGPAVQPEQVDGFEQVVAVGVLPRGEDLEQILREWPQSGPVDDLPGSAVPGVLVGQAEGDGKPEAASDVDGHRRFVGGEHRFR